MVPGCERDKKLGELLKNIVRKEQWEAIFIFCILLCIMY
jgi:hypothetical protein